MRFELAAAGLAAAFLAATPALAQSTGTSRAPGAPAPSSSSGPKLVLEVQTGVNGYTAGRGTATHVGPMWQARAWLHLTEWFSLGLAYTAGYNPGRETVVGRGVGLLNNGGYVSASLIAPFHGPVRPYAGVGIGYGWTTVTGSGGQDSVLQNDAGFFMPLGVGLDIDVTDRWSVGPQFVYQRSLGGGGAGSSPLNEGDNWNVGVSLGYEL